MARQLGVGTESLRLWVKPEIDDGARDGLTTDERKELTELRKENRDLKRSVDILQAAATSSNCQHVSRIARSAAYSGHPRHQTPLSVAATDGEPDT